MEERTRHSLRWNISRCNNTGWKQTRNNTKTIRPLLLVCTTLAVLACSSSSAFVQSRGVGVGSASSSNPPRAQQCHHHRCIERSASRSSLGLSHYDDTSISLSPTIDNTITRSSLLWGLRIQHRPLAKNTHRSSTTLSLYRSLFRRGGGDGGGGHGSFEGDSNEKRRSISSLNGMDEDQLSGVSQPSSDNGDSTGSGDDGIAAECVDSTTESLEQVEESESLDVEIEEKSDSSTCTELKNNPGINGDSNTNNDEDGDETKEINNESNEKGTINKLVPAVPSYILPLHKRVTISEDADALRPNVTNDERNSEQGDIDDGNEKQVSPSAIDDEGELSTFCNRGIIIVDNFSPYHGQYLSRVAREAYGVGVVNVLSSYVTGYLYQEKGLRDHLPARIPDEDKVEEWADQIPFEIVGIICESDSGLGEAERLGLSLGLFPDRCNGYNEARRDKFLMNECVSKHGLRVVQQKMCATMEEAIDFAVELGVANRKGNDAIQGLPMDNESSPQIKIETDSSGQDFSLEDLMDGAESKDESSNIDKDEMFLEELMDGIDSKKENMDADGEMDLPSHAGSLGRASNTPSELIQNGKYCIVKPCRGVASDNVHFCPDIDSVKDAFNKVIGSSVFGSIDSKRHEAVLIQEFASGTEYAIDIVSKAGHHKVAALWRYDKRAINGAPFVYFATEVVDADTFVGKRVCEYAMESLDALGVNWGMSHVEVIVDDDGPRLVEVNCRQHNTDFAPLTTACMGYNALDMLLAAYLGDATSFPPDTEHRREDWDDLPDLPVTRACGAVVHLVSHVEGVITEVHQDVLDEIESLPSVLAMEVYPQLSVGNHIEKTVDIRSDSGWVHIMHGDEEQFQEDYNRIVDLMPHMFSVAEEENNNQEDTDGLDV